MVVSSSSSSSYRDRTSEFHSLYNRLKSTNGNFPNNDPNATNLTPAFAPSLDDSINNGGNRIGSEFNRKASSIGSAIHDTSTKISRLAKLAKGSSMFNDPTVEIQELTALIKNDITALNIAVTELQTLQNAEMEIGNLSNDSLIHANTICDDLKNKLMETTKQFKDVLTTRTQNLKAHENRKQIFSANASRQNPFVKQPKSAPWSNVSNATNSPSSGITSGGVQNGNQLRRRLPVESSPSTQMLQQMVPQQESYTQNRADALQNVESTISELGGIFTQLATMVAHQGELAIRIDDNIDETLGNVEGARSALLKNLNRISSNRWLLIKIFAILILFLLIFVFFVV